MRNPFKKPEEQNPMTGGSSFDEAAARVTGVLEPEPAPPSADSETVVVGERLEIRPEWAEWFVRQPFEIGARLYHPAFAISDAQAEALGPKVLPLMQKIANEWIPSWLGSVGNRNPELLDAVSAIAVTAFFQWQYVGKIRRLEALAAARVEADKEAASGVADIPGASIPINRQDSDRALDGSRII